MGSDLRNSSALFKLGVGQVAEGLIQPLSIVKHFDVFKDRGSGLFSGAKLQLVNELIPQRAAEALGAGVIKAIAFARHAGTNAVHNEPLSVQRGGILAFLVGKSSGGKTGDY